MAYSSGLTPVRRGSAGSATVVAVGPSLGPVLEATAELDATVLYATTVRPFDAVTLRRYLDSPAVVLVEPHLAGTSSAEVSAALADTPHRLLALGGRPRRTSAVWAAFRARPGSRSGCGRHSPQRHGLPRLGGLNRNLGSRARAAFAASSASTSTA